MRRLDQTASLLAWNLAVGGLGGEKSLSGGCLLFILSGSSVMAGQFRSRSMMGRKDNLRLKIKLCVKKYLRLEREKLFFENLRRGCDFGHFSMCLSTGGSLQGVVCVAIDMPINMGIDVGRPEKHILLLTSSTIRKAWLMLRLRTRLMDYSPFIHDAFRLRFHVIINY